MRFSESTKPRDARRRSVSQSAVEKTREVSRRGDSLRKVEHDASFTFHLETIGRPRSTTSIRNYPVPSSCKQSSFPFGRNAVDWALSFGSLSRKFRLGKSKKSNSQASEVSFES